MAKQHIKCVQDYCPSVIEHKIDLIIDALCVIADRSIRLFIAIYFLLGLSQLIV